MCVKIKDQRWKSQHPNGLAGMDHLRTQTINKWLTALLCTTSRTVYAVQGLCWKKSLPLWAWSHGPHKFCEINWEKYYLVFFQLMVYNKSYNLAHKIQPPTPPIPLFLMSHWHASPMSKPTRTRSFRTPKFRPGN